MIDAWQATIVAYQTDGGIVHAKEDCVGSEPWADAAQASEERPNGLAEWQEFENSLDDAGFSALIRYNIHEWESSNEDDITDEEYLELLLEELSADVQAGRDRLRPDDYDGDEVTFKITVNVAHRIGVFCDHCGERIE